jgi:RNA polymerase sigma factor (sigma-70 family)
LVDECIGAGSGEEYWVRRAQAGDAEAWGSLVEIYQQPVFRLAYLLLGEPDDAEDVAQETFIRAYAALHRFRAGSPLRPWLMRIATNIAYNWRRRAHRYRAALDRVIAGKQIGLNTHTDRTSDADLLWQSVRRLNVKDQRAIYLRYFMDCSEEEMATVLNIPRGTVKSRLNRALSRLKEVLPVELLPEQEDQDARTHLR